MASDPVIIKSYEATDLRDATKAYERDARELAKKGYSPTGQSWAEGKRRGLGVLFAGGMIGRPKGTLTVTYRLG